MKRRELCRAKAAIACFSESFRFTKKLNENHAGEKVVAGILRNFLPIDPLLEQAFSDEHQIIQKHPVGTPFGLYPAFCFFATQKVASNEIDPLQGSSRLLSEAWFSFAKMVFGKFHAIFGWKK